MWSIRSISDVCVGIHWIGSGAVGKAAFMLVREVFNRQEMVILWSLVDYLQRTVKRLNTRYSEYTNGHVGWRSVIRKIFSPAK